MSWPAACEQQPVPMTHAERQALIRAPFFIEVIPPQKRWGGVQLMNDEDWMRQSEPRRYAHNGKLEDLVDSLEEY